MANAAETIGELRQETDNIGHVFDVIREIAASANPLAFNAAIEAARAGEQGRSFDIVPWANGITGAGRKNIAICRNFRRWSRRTRRSTSASSQRIKEVIQLRASGQDARAEEVFEQVDTLSSEIVDKLDVLATVARA